jgi:hypothetical protein
MNNSYKTLFPSEADIKNIFNDILMLDSNVIIVIQKLQEGNMFYALLDLIIEDNCKNYKFMKSCVEKYKKFEEKIGFFNTDELINMKPESQEIKNTTMIKFVNSLYMEFSKLIIQKCMGNYEDPLKPLINIALLFKNEKIFDVFEKIFIWLYHLRI